MLKPMRWRDLPPSFLKIKLTKLILVLVLLTATGCSSTKIATPDNYETIYHVVEYNRGDIVTTSAFQSSKTNVALKDFDRHLDFSKLVNFNARWGNISFFVHNEQRQCRERYTNLSLNLSKTVAKEILPRSDISIEIYFTPKENFSITESSTDDNTHRFFYPVNFCNPKLFPHQALEAAGKIVHETYHIMVFKSYLNNLPAEREEEYASLLQFCNGVLSDQKAKLNKEYFDSHISSQKIQPLSETEEISNKGRLKATLKIQAELKNNTNLINYCEKKVEKINHITFHSFKDD
ncbi:MULTISPECIES: hypothetical protein [unclassified Idiomarina]|uniref:hypothetical protein n=1 Tax=unclassified Idiomarina TaxID=2614829 RepID=UPI000C8DC216|nr:MULTISPECIES: hypothetical protein [unclassified Idiomarina]MAD53693.1 hypothetical protein [Idiomarinaceae bacterium]MEC7643604.1 hypothetical protein [Pseudomonadota bacterium]NQZ02976.1 hypothetical protein [Idiomarina sp.]|tara:strand:+ start:7692 stop:8567 length:876 start_codon:yes stop_codon:yes gene_type:complete